MNVVALVVAGLAFLVSAFGAVAARTKTTKDDELHAKLDAIVKKTKAVVGEPKVK